ncbi:MAG: ABC transporter substrate-binding protein [Deltaproteobacteria bacterium]|nr:ABC transporter substrate-binding protein [Deltaproteobacteria bacterium]
MIFRGIFSRRAFSVGLAGMALFLFACQSGKKLPPRVSETHTDPFVVARKYQESGNFQQALIQYQIFLKQAPKDKRIPLTLQGMSEIHLKLKEPEKALASLEQLSKSYPDSNWIPEVRYQISVILNQLGKYQASAGNAIHWLNRYQSHFLKKDVLVLLGDDFCKLGEAEAAFFCWVEAKRIWKEDPERETALDEKLKTLIATGRPMLLSRLLEREQDEPYQPEIYYQMSSSFLSQNDLDQAEKAAKILMASTRDLQWVSKGEEILARIKKKMAICGNCIGCLLPLSGPFAAYGQEVLNGITLGMVSTPTEGTKMELIVRDTAGSPEKALAELEALVNTEKVVGVIGPLSSNLGECQSLVPINRTPRTS